MTCKDIWNYYCSITNWHEAGKHVDYAFMYSTDTLWIFLQGSDELIDWIRDGQIVAYKSGSYYIHGGYLRCYLELLQSNVFSQQLILSAGLYKKIIIAGYSLGGSLALLLGKFLQDTTFFDTVTIVTFAAPNIFWIHAPKIYAVNIHIQHDIIPRLFSFVGYCKNPGKEIILPSPYHNIFKNHLPQAYTKALLRRPIDLPLV